MTAKKCAPIAVTMGEPGGIGLETTIKAWSTLNGAAPPFYLIDDPKRVKSAGCKIAIINDPSEAAAHFGNALPIFPIGTAIHGAAGQSDIANAPHVIEAINIAVNHALAGKAAGVTTNPIQKSTLNAHGFSFPGHTEYLHELTASTQMPQGLLRGPVMLLAGPDLRTVPVTIHQPLKEAIAALNTEAIFDTTQIVISSLIKDFNIQKPRINVAGLNPHAGENGVLGK